MALSVAKSADNRNNNNLCTGEAVEEMKYSILSLRERNGGWPSVNVSWPAVEISEKYLYNRQSAS